MRGASRSPHGSVSRRPMTGKSVPMHRTKVKCARRMSDTRPPPGSFLSYSPVELAFGTSGLRGLVTDITDLETYVNVRGAFQYLLATGDIAAGSVVPIAGDLRPSTERILAAA